MIGSNTHTLQSSTLCGECDGTGYVEYDDGTDYVDDEVCEECDGTGYADYAPTMLNKVGDTDAD